MSFLDARQDESVIDEIASLDLTRMTPLDALNTLYKLQSEVKNRI